MEKAENNNREKNKNTENTKTQKKQKHEEKKHWKKQKKNGKAPTPVAGPGHAAVQNGLQVLQR